MARDRARRPEARSLRLFVAFDVSPEASAAVDRAIRPWRDELPKARWVPSENWHITLKFLGEVQDKRVEDIDSGLTGLSWKPFVVSVRGVGFFPGTRSPRVFWG